jgi:hypothetical protein
MSPPGRHLTSTTVNGKIYTSNGGPISVDNALDKIQLQARRWRVFDPDEAAAELPSDMEGDEAIDGFAALQSGNEAVSDPAAPTARMTVTRRRPRLRGSMIFRRVAARLRSSMLGAWAIWMASRKVLHSRHRVMRLSASTLASRAEISSC